MNIVQTLKVSSLIANAALLLIAAALMNSCGKSDKANSDPIPVSSQPATASEPADPADAAAAAAAKAAATESRESLNSSNSSSPTAAAPAPHS